MPFNGDYSDNSFIIIKEQSYNVYVYDNNYNISIIGYNPNVPLIKKFI